MSDSLSPAFDLVFQDFGQINFLLIFFIIFASFGLLFIVKRVMPVIAEIVPGKFRFYILTLVPVFRLGILIVAIFSIVPLIIKPTLQNFVAIFVSAGFALAFAFKDYISSLIAGIVVIYEQPYRQGDWVQIDGAYGEIRNMGLRSIQIVTPDDTVVSIPHSKIWNSNIYNANFGKREHLCVADFYLHPEHDAGIVRQKLMDVALTSQYINLNKPATVIISEKPWGTHYRVKAYPVQSRDEFQFITDITLRAKNAFNELGVRPAFAPVSVSENN